VLTKETLNIFNWSLTLIKLTQDWNTVK